MYNNIKLLLFNIYSFLLNIYFYITIKLMLKKVDNPIIKGILHRRKINTKLGDPNLCLTK